MNEDFIMITSMVIGFILLLSLIFLGLITADYLLHNYPIEITKDNRVIYSGVKSCANIDSSGDTTTISISQGFLCLFPKATITGRNIEVRTK